MVMLFTEILCLSAAGVGGAVLYPRRVVILWLHEDSRVFERDPQGVSPAPRL